MVRQAEGRISHVADRKDHSVDVQVHRLVRSLAGDIAVTLLKDVLYHGKPVDATVCAGLDAMRRTQKAKAQASARSFLRRLGKDWKGFLRQFADVLADGAQLSLDAAQLGVKS